MTKYRANEAIGLALMGLGLFTGAGLVGALIYGVYDARKNR
jgi:hypothetical protein